MSDFDNKSEGQAIGAEALTFDDTAGGIPFTAAKITQDGSSGKLTAGKAVFRLEGGSIRFTVDGTAPTTTVGIPVKGGTVDVDNVPGDLVVIEGRENIKAFRAIRVGVTSGTAFVTYYKKEISRGIYG